MKLVKKRTNKFGCCDFILTKLAIIALTLFVIGIWPAAMSWVHSVNPWYFLIVAVILLIKPFYRLFIKKKNK